MSLQVILEALSLVFVLFATPAQAQTDAVFVIVGADSPIEELSDQEVRQIFTARRLRIGDQRVSIAVNPGQDDIYARLTQTLTGRSARAFGMLWLEAGFQNAAPEPLLVADEDEMVQRVASTPGMIGYTLTPRPSGPVRVVGRLPFDGG